MTEQRRNDSMVELLRADFFGRDEPNAAWSHTVSDHMLLPGLRGLWPMSANHVSGADLYVDDLACDYDLEMVNNPLLQLLGYGLPPCCQFAIASTNYLTYGADDVQHDILGTEANVLSTQRGLALGCWVKFGRLGTASGVIDKWATAGNQRAYRLYKSAADAVIFEVSNLGTAASTVTVTSTATIAINTWYHVFCRFVPSTALDIYVDGAATTLAAGVPAAVFNSTAILEMGRTDGGSYLEGYLSLAWLAASRGWDNVATTRNVLPVMLYEHSRRMFNK